MVHCRLECSITLEISPSRLVDTSSRVNSSAVDVGCGSSCLV